MSKILIQSKFKTSNKRLDWLDIATRWDFRVTSLKQQRGVISSKFGEIATRCDFRVTSLT